MVHQRPALFTGENELFVVGRLDASELRRHRTAKIGFANDTQERLGDLETWRNWSDAGEWALKCVGSNPTVSKHCRVTKLVDVSDFDSDDESHGGSSPSSVAIMPHIPSYGGEERREGRV